MNLWSGGELFLEEFDWTLYVYQVGGLIAMAASFYFLSQGWAMATYSPFYILLFIYYCIYVNFGIMLNFSLSWITFLFLCFWATTQACHCELNLELPFKDSLDSEVETEEVLGVMDMAVPIFAGILSALRRVIARRVSLKVFESGNNRAE